MIETVERLLNKPSLSPLEWLATSTRVLWLTALLIIAGMTDRLSVWVILIILLWIAFSITGPLASGQKWRIEDLNWGAAAIDIIFSLLLISISGVFSSPLWSSLLVGALSAGLSFGIVGAMAVAGVGVIGSAVLGLILTKAGLWTLAPLGMYVGAIMMAAAVIGLVAEQLRWMTPYSGVISAGGTDPDYQRQRMRAIFPMVAEMNATLNYERVLDMALDVSASALSNSQPEEDRLVGGLLLYDGEALRLVSGRRLTHADSRVTIPGDQGLIGDVFSTGDPRLGRHPDRDPEIKHLVGFHKCRQVLGIPLSAGLETYGIMLFGHPSSDYFNAERVELLEAIGQQAMVALQNARLYRDLEQEKERIMQIEEEARSRLARDLHDGPTQSVAALAMRVNFARRLLERDPKAASQELFKVEDLARRTTKEIRHMLFTLRPLILESQGLVMALKQLAEKVKDTLDQTVIIQSSPDVAKNLEMGKQGVIFYIIEEAVSNAAKHAEAEHIWVRLKEDGDLFVLEVEDDGVGFDVGAVDKDYAQRGSLGMVNMRERAELVNGVFHLESETGVGTRITVIVPMTEESAERLHRPGGMGQIGPE
jgi:signal transduction histidine kinase